MSLPALRPFATTLTQPYVSIHLLTADRWSLTMLAGNAFI